MNTLLKIIKNNKLFIGFIFILILFRGAIADWHPVPTGSMKPNILEGDVIWENKIAYDLRIPFTNTILTRLGEPKRGDIIVFASEAADKLMIKRLVGLPGDEITVNNNQLIINNKPADYLLEINSELSPERKIDQEKGVYAIERIADKPQHIIHVKPKRLNPMQNTPTKTVPKDHYFVMGDNRDNSLDSRYYGTVPRHEIKGKATHTILSLNTLDKYKPRFERFFETLK